MDVEPPVMIWLRVSLQDQITVQITSCITSVQELKLVHNATADLLAVLPSSSTCSLVSCDFYWLPLSAGFSHCPVKSGVVWSLCVPVPQQHLVEVVNKETSAKHGGRVFFCCKKRNSVL